LSGKTRSSAFDRKPHGIDGDERIPKTRLLMNAIVLFGGMIGEVA
jgi:hypothetical protein